MIENKEEVLIIFGQKIHSLEYQEISNKLSILMNTPENLVELMKKSINDEFHLSEDLHNQALALKLINSNGAMEKDVKLVIAYQGDLIMTYYALQSSIKTFYSLPQSYKSVQKALEKTCHAIIEQKISEKKEDSKEEVEPQVNNCVPANKLLQFFEKSKIDADLKELEEKFKAAIKEKSADEDKNESSWFSSCSLQ